MLNLSVNQQRFSCKFSFHWEQSPISHVFFTVGGEGTRMSGDGENETDARVRRWLELAHEAQRQSQAMTDGVARLVLLQISLSYSRLAERAKLKREQDSSD